MSYIARERPERRANEVLWLWVDGKLMKEPFLLWGCWTGLSNWCPVTTQWQFHYKFHATSTWSHEFPLPTWSSVSPSPDRIWPKEHGHHWFLFFQHKKSLKQRFSELNRNPTMNAWVYLNISSLTKEILGIRRSSEFEVKRPWRDLALLIITWVPLGSSLACKMGTVSPSLPPKRVFCEYQFR